MMMNVSGFSIIRNARKFGYPVIEAISSILPVCDELIVNVGKSDDDTLDLIRSIASDKVKIIEQEWDLSLRSGGELLARETNRALDQCKGDWCFYIQADEVLHEQYLPVVREEMEKEIDNVHMEGFEFGYKHFYGSYDYYQDNFRQWYIRGTRIIRRNLEIVSWGDGMDFRRRDGSALHTKRMNAEIYHYGWVRPPHTMIQKNLALHAMYHTDEEIHQDMESIQKPYDDLGHLKRFSSSHPRMMAERIAISRWDFDAKINDQLPDWLRYVILFFQPLTKRLLRLMGRAEVR